MADIRALSAVETSALQNGTYEGVKLLSYYKKVDAPEPIMYSRTSTDQGEGRKSSIINWRRIEFGATADYWMDNLKSQKSNKGKNIFLNNSVNKF